jgi:predicted dehydrogenase
MLKAGLIGMGRMGITHFSILNTHPSVNIVSVADTSKTMLNILDKYLNIRTYQDYHQMLDNEYLDFVVISTPSDSHSEIITNALRKNLHIFTEKPFTINCNEGERIIDCLREKKLVNQVGYVNRFNEVFMQVKELLNKEMIGEIKDFHSEMYGATVLKGSNATWRSKRKTGGGCMYEFASHCLDLVVYLFGQPDKVKSSILQNVYSVNVEDIVKSTLIYKEGLSGNITVNWSDESYRKPANIITIFGTKGKIIADKHALRLYNKNDQKLDGFKLGWNTKYITDFAKSVRHYVRGNEFTRQLDYFVNNILESNYKNIADFEEAHKTDVLIERIIKNANQTILKDEDEIQGNNIFLKDKSYTIGFWERLRKYLRFKNA